MKHPLPAGVDVSRETLERLELFVQILSTWTRTVNLIARADQAQIWQRHIVDSLQLVRHIPPGLLRAFDLGSGGGMPGLVLAIASDVPFTLIESDQRKAAFLQEAARQTAAPVTVVNQRIEQAKLEPALLVTARALAPLSTLLALAAPLLLPGGTLLALKGRKAGIEIEDARHSWDMKLTRTQSMTDPDAAILTISEVQRVQNARKAATTAARPPTI